MTCSCLVKCTVPSKRTRLGENKRSHQAIPCQQRTLHVGGGGEKPCVVFFFLQEAARFLSQPPQVRSLSHCFLGEHFLSVWDARHNQSTGANGQDPRREQKEHAEVRPQRLENRAGLQVWEYRPLTSLQTEILKRKKKGGGWSLSTCLLHPH